MISPRTKPCRKECPTPKKLEGYRSGRGRQYNPYHDHWLRLRYTTIEERTQPTGAYIYYTTYFFVQFFYLNNYSLRDPPLHMPRFYLFSRPTFVTPFRDSHSRPHFATHICDPHSRLTFATQFRDSRSRLPSRLDFPTRVRDHTRDSRSRLPIVLPTATRYFFVATSVVRLHH